MLCVALLAGWLAMAYWQSVKPLPQGTHVAGAVCPVAASQVSFIADITAADAYGHLVVSQGIFDEVLKVVRGARHFIVLDYALLGAAAGAQPQRHLAAELTDALLEARRAQPDLRVLLVTDPVNERYGASRVARASAAAGGRGRGGARAPGCAARYELPVLEPVAAHACLVGRAARAAGFPAAAS